MSTDRPEPAAPRRILVVDDEPSVLKSVARDLDRAGYDVWAANGVADALELLARRGRFDLMVCDVNLPGILGPTLGTLARKMQPELRIVYMSGDESRRELDTKRVAVLYKPFGTDVLLDTVQRVFAGAFADADADDADPSTGR